MNKTLLSFSILATLLLSSPLSAHGGTYRGPGDTVPPAGGGAATPATPATPSTPSTPSTPGTPTPATPSTPNTPNTPTPAAQPKTQTTPTTAGAQVGPDLTTWEFWWEFNKEPYLNLKAKVHSGDSSTGEGDILLGLGANAPKNNTFAPTPSQIRGSILPALTDALAKEDQRDIATACMVALAKVGMDPAQVASAFQKRHSTGDQEVSETAAVSLGILQQAEALDDLMNLLADNEAGRKLVGKPGGVPLRNRAFAAFGMGLVANATEDAEVKQKIGNRLWETLSTDTSALKDVRVACAVSLGLMEPADPTALATNLLEFLQDDEKDPLVRAHCPTAIAKLLKNAEPTFPLREKAISDFLALLSTKKTKNEVRQSCVQALGVITHGSESPSAKKVFDTLTKLGDKARNKQEQNFTAISLAYLGASVDDSDPMRQDVTRYLVENVRKAGTGYRPWCGMALGVMSFLVQERGGQVNPVAFRAVEESFNKEKSPSPKACYAVSLGLMKNEAAKEAIRASLDKVRDDGYRGYACVALGLMGAREHKDYVTKIVKESTRRPDLLRQASIALGLMKDRSVVNTLLEIMVPPDGGKPRLAVLSATATALGFIGDTRSVNPLIATLQNDKLTDLGRAFAAVALGMVADKESLPWNSKIGQDLNYRAAVDTLVDQAGGSGIMDIL